MREAIAIRAAGDCDLDAIVAIERESSTAAHWPRVTYERILRGTGEQPLRGILIAARAEVILGFCVVSAVLSSGRSTECELENIAVAGPAQRRGIGGLLLRQACEWARERGAKRLNAEVRESNGPARGMYRAAGFGETARRAAYYDLPAEAAILLTLHI